MFLSRLLLVSAATLALTGAGRAEAPVSTDAKPLDAKPADAKPK